MTTRDFRAAKTCGLLPSNVFLVAMSSAAMAKEDPYSPFAPPASCPIQQSSGSAADLKRVFNHVPQANEKISPRTALDLDSPEAVAQDANEFGF